MGVYSVCRSVICAHPAYPGTASRETLSNVRNISSFTVGSGVNSVEADLQPESIPRHVRVMTTGLG